MIDIAEPSLNRSFVHSTGGCRQRASVGWLNEPALWHFVGAAGWSEGMQHRVSSLGEVHIPSLAVATISFEP